MTSKSNELHSGWTPGPWALDGGSCEHGVSAVTTDHEGRHTRRSTVVMLCDYSEPDRLEKVWMADNWRNDAALIALAPEMAEAILRVQEAEDQDAQCRDEKEFLAAWREFHHVHAKIRTLKDST